MDVPAPSGSGLIVRQRSPESEPRLRRAVAPRAAAPKTVASGAVRRTSKPSPEAPHRPASAEPKPASPRTAVGGITGDPGRRTERVSACAVTFLGMSRATAISSPDASTADLSSAGPAGLPSPGPTAAGAAAGTASGQAATSPTATPSVPGRISGPTAVPAAVPVGTGLNNGPTPPFEHGTDAQMIERRVRTVTPLITPTPGPGASSTLRREVLYALRTGGPAAPDQIAERVGASRTGVLQQLRTLESAGLVTRNLSRHGVGRPRHVYDLTAAAQELFPANYGALAQSILTAVRSVGGEKLIRDVFEARRHQLKTRIRNRLAERLPAGASLWERVREVAIYEDETGYLGRATRDPDGTIWLSEHNCAISGVSGPYPIACQEELELFCDVLGAKVTRECHIPSGDRSCRYRVEPLGQPGEAGK